MSDRFERLLKSRIGLDAGSVGSAMIERVVRQRISSCALCDKNEYWMRLSGSASEIHALIEAVVVPETWFFRYPESFTTLVRLAFERLPSLTDGRLLRVLSLPRSTGEELYSIVMALLDAGLSEFLFEIDALDVSTKVIERANQAVYGKNSFRSDSLSFRDRYFSETTHGYRLAEQVRRKVRFLRGNLLDPGLLVGESPYDFVFCRNLLIYFDRPTQRTVVEVLKRLLLPDGAMFIGPAEASLISRHGMQAVGVPLSFVFRCIGVEPVQSKALSVESHAASHLPGTKRGPAKSIASPVGPRWRLAGPVLMPSDKPSGTEDDDELKEIARLANGEQHQEARAACEQYLARHGPSAAAFYWLGLLSDIAGQVSEAQELYRKALYLKPQYPEALAHLAALRAACGDHAGARRLQQRAARGVNDD